MAHGQPANNQERERELAGPSRRRRRFMLGVGCLLGIVVTGAATISIMLQRLEARNANFQPPMTTLEREQLLPPDPVLQIKPQVDGIRYGADVEASTGTPAPSADNGLQLSRSPLDERAIKPGDPLGVTEPVHMISHAR